LGVDTFILDLLITLSVLAAAGIIWVHFGR
jgi:hypothetical protein